MNKVIITIIAITSFFGMLIAPDVCINAALRGMNLCATAIIPSLLPFFICVKIFTNSGLSYKMGKCMSKIMRPVFNLPGESAFALVMGMLSGYPIGAKCAIDMYEKNGCTKDEAQRIICFCNNSGPMFVIGTVGTVMLLNKRAGVILYVSHILSALTIGIFLGLKRKDETVPVVKKELLTKKPILADAVNESINLILYVCGFIIFFNIFVALLELTNIMPKEILYCIFEITNGIAALSATAVSSYKLPLISLVLGWSGISIILQVIGITENYGFSKIKFILSKLIQGAISFVYTTLILKIPMFSSLEASKDITKLTSTFNSISLLVFGLSIIYLIYIFSKLIPKKRP